MAAPRRHGGASVWARTTAGRRAPPSAGRHAQDQPVDQPDQGAATSAGGQTNTPQQHQPAHGREHGALHRERGHLVRADAKETVPRLLIVDGQQRLTSLFAVLTGTLILAKDYSQARIRIAFRPADARFEVTDAAIERDPEFIADITNVWLSYRETTPGYFARLKEHREDGLERAEEDRLDDAIDRLKDLAHYPFKAVELDSAVDEERVAEIFVRINSEGVPSTRPTSS